MTYLENKQLLCPRGILTSSVTLAERKFLNRPGAYIFVS